MQDSPPWEANNHSDTQEIPRLLWNPKVHYCVHNSTSLIPILSHVNQIYYFSPYFLKIHSNIIIESTPGSSEWSLPFRLSNQNIVCIFNLCHARYMSRPSHPPWSDHPNNIWWSVQVMKLLIMQSSPASRHFLRLRSKYSPTAPCCQTPSVYAFTVNADKIMNGAIPPVPSTSSWHGA
jgi:hypothetical protein